MYVFHIQVGRAHVRWAQRARPRAGGEWEREGWGAATSMRRRRASADITSRTNRSDITRSEHTPLFSTCVYSFEKMLKSFRPLCLFGIKNKGLECGSDTKQRLV